MGRRRFGYILLWVVTAAVLAAAAAWCYTQPGAVRFGPADRQARTAESAALDLNAATAAELDELPGIGEVMAERLLAWRAEHGPFTGREDVLAVPGVGPALWEAMAPYVFFGDGGQPPAG